MKKFYFKLKIKHMKFRLSFPVGKYFIPLLLMCIFVHGKNFASHSTFLHESRLVMLRNDSA